MPTLADKLEFLFRSKLVPLATKNKAKSPEEDVFTHFKLIIHIETI